MQSFLYLNQISSYTLILEAHRQKKSPDGGQVIGVDYLWLEREKVKVHSV
ncbi:hypothetical protein SynBOUM118_02313 [Synechococcus sp. BOUM118]|nr:hypothetical protein SynBOUM118_02313 [Synechococcus sp. BOUM118]